MFTYPRVYTRDAVCGCVGVCVFLTNKPQEKAG